ncbi:MAG: hypothetical protein ACFFA6_05850 [Promethearchaeota archaeon]
MKPRSSLICLILVFIFMIGIISNVSAYKCGTGISVGENLIWKCNLCKNSKLDNIFGGDWDASGIFENINKGKKMKWEINNLEVNDTHIKIEFSIWLWTNEANWGIMDNNSQMVYYSNPKDYTETLNFSNYKSFVPFWFPTPIGEYMGGLTLYKWYDVDNRVLPTLNVDIKKDDISPGYPSKDIKIIAIYNEQGVLNSYKLYIDNYVVLIDISLDTIPWYVVPTLIILTVIFSLGIIFYIIRKRKRIVSGN